MNRLIWSADETSALLLLVVGVLIGVSAVAVSRRIVGKDGPTRHYVIATASSVLFLALVQSWRLDIVLLFAFLLLLALVDVQARRVPNFLIYPALIVAAVGMVVAPVRPMPHSLIGGLFAFGVFFLTWRIRPGELGGGDVKLAAFLGFVLGFPSVLWALLVATLFGVVAIYIQTTRQKQAKFPYAPYLCLGGVVTLLVDPTMWLF